MRMRYMLAKPLWLIVAGMLSLTSAFAGTTGKIAGRVVDAKTGEPLPGVNVFIEGTTLGAATNVEGYYSILRVPPGVYTVRARMIGYTEQAYTQVRVSIDKTTRLDFRLQETVLELGEAVEVVATRPLVQKDLTSTQATVSSDVIEALPVETFSEVVNLQAGVVNGHFRGGRIGEVAYLIDGIPVNDVYSGDYAVQVENSSIQELEVISGTFNAEYGQAMSGVVNIVTKEGGETYSGKIETYFGDYLSKHTDIFWGIDKLNPVTNLELTLSGPVPLAKKKITFFANTRYYDNEGYIYGKDVFRPQDQSDFTKDRPENWTVESHGQRYPFSEALARQLIDNADVKPMNSNARFTAQLKLSFRVTASDKFTLETLVQRSRWRQYDHRFRLNPDGDYRYRRNALNNIFTYTRVLSPNSFLTLKGAFFDTRFKQFVYEDAYDPRYVSSRRLQDTGANAFLSGGQQMWHFKRSTRTAILKAEFTSQVTRIHQVKAGLEYRKHRLWLHEYEVVPELPNRIPPITSYNNNDYLHRPVEFSAYVQDKIELDYMVVNAGLRFDYFNPDGGVPVDFRAPDESEKVRAEPSTQVSPRLGIAYPITDRGVIHVSYGHFFQIPNFRYLYTNPEFDIFPLQSTPSPPPQSLLNTVGNAALKPQKTIMYEIGLQQQLTDNLGLYVTVFNKDIRNLLGTEVRTTLQGIRYGRYINRDYGNVRGFTVALEHRMVQNFGATLDYTFQIAKGNASDPNTAFLDQQADPPKQTEKQLVPLDWDRRHQLNLTVTLGNKQVGQVSIIARLGTGLPYTPTFQNVQTAVENSGRRPTVHNVDLYAYKTLVIGKHKITGFLRVFNVFDRLNELEVFTDTGRASYTLAPLYTGGLRPRGLNPLDMYFKRPDFFSPPRQVQIGFSYSF
ncbi:MAG: TonB-dependent receptor [candidate division KSB1 bacterium]|nr:TonB-dependent receptor [candidate division KSB1 bacterium]